jgi:carbon-monoxide dehydrogenase small subunit
MTINFILNGEDVLVNSEAGVRLIYILRRNFSLFGAKAGCLSGQCGACSVIFNGHVIPACLIPAFRIRGSEVITIEGFSQTDEYHEIIDGFAQAKMSNCGYCDAGKILCAEALLEKIPNPSKKQILTGFNGIKCRCTDGEKLVEAVNIIAGIRERRNFGRSY